MDDLDKLINGNVFGGRCPHEGKATFHMSTKGVLNRSSRGLSKNLQGRGVGLKEISEGGLISAKGLDPTAFADCTFGHRWLRSLETQRPAKIPLTGSVSRRPRANFLSRFGKRHAAIASAFRPDADGQGIARAVNADVAILECDSPVTSPYCTERSYATP